MKHRILSLTLFLGFLMLITPLEVSALINPNFTPIDLIEQSVTILEVEFSGRADGGKVQATVEEKLKGKVNFKTLVFDLSASAYKDQAKLVGNLIVNSKGKAASAMFFVGAFREEGSEEDVEEEDEDGEGGQKAFLHFRGMWMVFYSGKGNVWEMDSIDQHMQGTWAGGTDMLRRAVDYVMSDEDADVPIKSFVEWLEKGRIAKVSGKVFAAQPVDLNGDGALFLHIAAENGDMLFSYDKKADTLKDVTKTHGLKARSRVSVWGDFNADQRIDLLSFDGKAMTLHCRSADGTFQAGTLETGNVLDDGCIGLTAIGCGEKGKPGVLAATAASPVLFMIEGGKAWSVRKLAAGDFPGKDMGAGGLCLAADFDDDGLPDILQMFSNGGLFYKGTGLGNFAQPVECQVALGTGRSHMYAGDFDGDGLLDIFTVAEDGNRLWHNVGKAKFVETLRLSGEIAYIAKPEGIGGATCDINNDGRQDIFILYSGRAPHHFFNRGFRSTGHAHMLDIAEKALLPQAEEGQQAGCMGDFNNDGAQDMVLVLNNGETWIFFRDTEDEDALCVRAVLSVKDGYPGPLTVTGWTGKRCLGAWSVTAGTAEAFLGQREAGPCRLKWRFPGGKEKQKEIVLEDGPVRFVVRP